MGRRNANIKFKLEQMKYQVQYLSVVWTTGSHVDYFHEELHCTPS